jgi:hypothetical protein
MKKLLVWYFVLASLGGATCLGDDYRMTWKYEQWLLKQLNSENGVARIAGVLYKVEGIFSDSPVEVTFDHAGGRTTIAYERMTARQQELFGYDAALAKRWPYLSREDKEKLGNEWRYKRRIKQAKALE